MKKLISIGVALAVLAVMVLPVGAAAQCPDIGYTYPQTYAKIPFAILQSGLELTGDILGTLASTLGLPDWLDDLVITIAPWTGGPLSWTVDMLGWGLDLVAGLLGALAAPMGLPDWLDDLVSGIACGLFTPWTCNYSGVANFTPCSTT